MLHSSFRPNPFAGVLLFALSLAVPAGIAQNSVVIYPEGFSRGVATLSTPAGDFVASGDMRQVVHPNGEVESWLVFHFKDGSIDSDDTVFTQKGRFRLVRDHHIQKGHSFPHPEDTTIDVPAGTVREIVSGGDGQKFTVKHVDFPANIANGMLTTAIKNMPDAAQEADVTYYSDGRLVRLEIFHEGTGKYWVAQRQFSAKRYVVKIKIGGLAGMVAPLLGKQPQDLHAWYMEGEPPLMLRIDSQLYAQGPVWRFELAGPAWHAAGARGQ